MRLRLLSNGENPSIITLWSQVFGDSPKAVAAFFEAFPHCLSYVAEEAGEIVSMVHALPRILSPDIPAAYLYAVATAETHRGRGLCRQLMAFAEADLRSRGFACCVLTPGEPGLFRFYETLGYRADFTRNRTAFSGGDPISAAEYAALRQQLLALPHLVCDLPLLEYAARVYGLTFYRTETGIAAAGQDDTAECLPEDLGGEPFAMIKWLCGDRPLRNAYLAFPLE